LRNQTEIVFGFVKAKEKEYKGVGVRRTPLTIGNTLYGESLLRHQNLKGERLFLPLV